MYWNVRGLIKIAIIVLLAVLCFYFFLNNGYSDYKGESGSLLSVDSCEYYGLILKGNASQFDYDSIRNYLHKTVYKSKQIEKSIFFQQGHSESPALYVHAKLKGEEWESTVVCNDSNLDSTVVTHLLEVSSELVAMARKKYTFNEIYFYCSILDR